MESAAPPTPASLGYVLPAEWERHSRCWMAWPCREAAWHGRIAEAREAYARVAHAIARFEPVTMIANPADVTDASLACGTGVDVLPLPIDDSWTRDSGPMFLTDRQGGLAGVDGRFNAWGQRYRPYDQDARLARRLLERQGLPRFESPLVLEGGAVHGDGDGTLLVTESTLLNANRNPGLTRDEAERRLADTFGCQKVIWLAGGLEHDETDGHIDNIACFARPGVVLALVTDDPGDGNHAVLQDNLARLRGARDARDRPLEVIEIPQPGRRERDGVRLSLSYINFYIANGAVIVPSFEIAEDSRVVRLLSAAFPDRRIVQVPAADIVTGGGGIHCITLQQPAP